MNAIARPLLLKHWKSCPYDIHRLIIEQVRNGQDLINYLQTFDKCNYLCEIRQILDVYKLSGLEKSQIWPCLSLEANTTFSDSLILAISRTCHLYTSICFKSFVKYEDFLKMVNSNLLHVTLDLTNNESDMHALLKGYDIGELSKVNRLIFARNKMVKIDLFNLSYALRGASRLECIDLTSCHVNGDFKLLASLL
jgi:hypothetical protein